MHSKTFTIRFFALLAIACGLAFASTGTAEAGGCGYASQGVYVPARTVYVQPKPVVRKVVVVQSTPVYRPACR